MTDSEERRGPDRRETVDLTRPAHLDRRQPGMSRRDEDNDRYAEQQASLPPGARRPVDITDLPVPSKPLAELEADLAELQAAMAARNQQLQELSPEDYEAAQARDGEIVQQWAVQVRRLEREIAAAREKAAGE